ncbi:MAG TPA: hypothetical protein DCX53_06070 [Anaerolineae bacterium]|nr:hypothetical protein [Anaerolineae bacterium]
MNRPNPSFNDTEANGIREFQYELWRERFLRSIQIGGLVFGLIALIPNLITAPNAVFITIFLTAYFLLILTTVIKFSYNVRAGMIVFLLYGLGVSGIFENGLWGDARLFFLAFVCMSLLVFNYRFGIIATGLSMVTFAIGGWLVLNGQIKVSSLENSAPGSPAAWIEMGVVLLLLSAIFIAALKYFQDEFSQSQEISLAAFNNLQRGRTSLETLVDDRTAQLTKKTEQFRAASYIARQTAELQDLESILKVSVDLITDQFGYYHAGIFLMNESDDEVILQEASSEGGRRMLEKGHSLKVGSQGIVGYAASAKKPRIALDVGADAVFFNNLELPATRSEIALPLVIRNKVLGILDIQSDQPQAFNVDDIDVLQTLADQIAVAIENIRLLDEAQTALKQIEALTILRTREAWSQKSKEGNFTFTYTPLGMRAGKPSDEFNQSIKIPIALRGQKIGSISLARKNNSPWSAIDLAMVNEVAYQTGLAVDNVRLVEEATERARQEQTVGELATRFSQATEVDSLLQTAARELGQVADVAEVSVYIGQIPEQSPNKKRSRRVSG